MRNCSLFRIVIHFVLAETIFKLIKKSKVKIYKTQQFITTYNYYIPIVLYHRSPDYKKHI